MKPQKPKQLILNHHENRILSSESEPRMTQEPNVHLSVFHPTSHAEINQTLSDLPEFIQACLVYSIAPAAISELNATCKDVIYRATELSKRVWPHGNDNFNPLDANAVVSSKYQILTKCIDTGIEVKKLEEDHQREFGHRLGGLFLDPGHDLQLLVPASINSTFQDFQ